MRTVSLSDFTDNPVTDDNRMAVIVWNHPLVEGPVQLDAAKGDLAVLEDRTADCVVLELVQDDDRHYVVLDVAEFDRLFKGSDPDDVLRRAPKYGRKPANGTRDYTQPDTFGLVHKSVASTKEKELVRENLEQANANRRREGQPEISLSNPDDVRKYGLEELVSGRMEVVRPRPQPRPEAAEAP